MKEYIEQLFSNYRQKGALIDTNILLLYFIGSVNKERIPKFNRTKQFSVKDYELLLKIFAYFQKVVTTPNILTEVNSLANQLGEPERSQCFKRFAQDILRLDESYVESRAATTVAGFIQFGLTDCGIQSLATNRYLVLTDDLKLAVHLQREGVDTVNFNNLRVSNWR